MDIRKELFNLQDIKYRDFQAKLIPTMDAEAMIGVRTPDLRKLAKTLVRESGLNARAGAAEAPLAAEVRDFLADLPHEWFDENQLHAFIISEIRDYDTCIAEVERFLPFVDNWATCDQLSPKTFSKHRDGLLPYIRKWIGSEETYTVRFAIGMLMQHYLDEDFAP